MAAIPGLTMVIYVLLGVCAGAVVALGAPRLNDLLINRRLARLSKRRRTGQNPLQTVAPASPEQRLSHEVPDELVGALAQGSCVLFAGAELSAHAGLPTGDTLLTRMIDRLEELDPAGDWVSLREQHESGQTVLVTELLRRRLGPDGVREVLVSILSSSSPSQRPRLFEALASVPFAGLVTDQWDDSLVTAFKRGSVARLTPTTCASGSDVLREGRFFALKLYGDLREPNDLLFTVEDYREALQAEPDFATFVATLLRAYTFLFIGATLGELESFLALPGWRTTGVQRHVALMPDSPGLSVIAERMKNRYGVTLLSFDGSEGLTSVAPLLDAVTEAAEAEQLTPSRARRVRDSSRIESIALRDIGPFRRLDLELGDRWTILLGDNASGKSTILRAIAIALAGDSLPLGGVLRRTLRSEASTGTIALRIGKTTYRTELRRQAGRVRVVADSVTPVQGGMWLAIGFPPLRGISTEDPKGAFLGPAAPPGADDLAALCGSSVDDRLNDLKQWVFTTWLLANDGGSTRSERYRAMLDQFFTVVNRLTPGIPFRFTGVDSETGEILLSSPDGKINIDMLSQGISSILAWVGVLLERMYEVYEEDPEPYLRRALVLVDEIDAHLHPDWQSRLLPELRNLFPEIQLIATTHSPLIVGSTEPGEVIHLEQEDGLRGSRQLDVAFRGMRADQILTSAAFDLGSTRDRATTEMLKDYRKLKRKSQLSDAEQRQLETLTHRLREVLPYPQETPLAREAAALVNRVTATRIQQELDGASTEQLHDLAEEARAYAARLERDRLTE
jgi:hypothetical protein